VLEQHHELEVFELGRQQILVGQCRKNRYVCLVHQEARTTRRLASEEEQPVSRKSG